MPRLTLDLSSEIDTRLTEISRKEGISKAEAMRKAFALLALAQEEKAKGNSMGIVKQIPDSDELKALGIVIGI